MEVNADMNRTSTYCTYKHAINSSQNSLPGCRSLVCLREEDILSASLNGCQSSQLSSAGEVHFYPVDILFGNIQDFYGFIVKMFLFFCYCA